MKPLFRSLPALFLLLSLVMVNAVNATTLEKSSEKTIKIGTTSALGKFTARVSSDQISVSESLTLTLEISEPVGSRARIPSLKELGFANDFTERSQRFRLTDVSDLVSKTQADGSTLLSQTYTLEPWLSGDYAILPIMVPFYEANKVNGKEGDSSSKAPELPLFSLMTDGIRIKVTPLTGDRHQLSPIFGQATLDQKNLLDKQRQIDEKSDEELRREKEEKNEAAKALQKKHFPWWIIWLLLALLVIAPALWRLNRRKGQSFFRKPETPPHIKAFLAFTALQNKQLLQNGLVKEFYYELSFILREYIGGRFGIFADRQTTEEFFQKLLVKNPFDSISEQILRDFSEGSDTVKYSQYRPDHAQAEESLRVARSFVEKTKEPEESKAEIQASQ